MAQRRPRRDRGGRKPSVPYYAGLLPVLGSRGRELVNFSSRAVCLVIASERYDEADYIRDYDEFVALRERGYRSISLSASGG